MLTINLSSRYQSTHIKGGVLDLILTSHPHLFKSCHIKPDQLRLISDHYPILARLEMVSDQQVNHVPHRDKRYKWCTNPDAADWVSFAHECDIIAPRVHQLIESINTSTVHRTYQQRINYIWRLIVDEVINRAAIGNIAKEETGTKKKKHWWNNNNTY